MPSLAFFNDCDFNARWLFDVLQRSSSKWSLQRVPTLSSFGAFRSEEVLIEESDRRRLLSQLLAIVPRELRETHMCANDIMSKRQRETNLVRFTRRFADSNVAGY